MSTQAVNLEVVNAYELYMKNLPPTNWIVKPIIHEGATLLTGDPKVGKSFLALQIALAVAGGDEYLEGIKLQKLAQAHGIALLILHHTNKREGNDPIARSSGSHGLTGAVDSVLMLSRQSGGHVLAARPRDAEESSYGLERLSNGGWHTRLAAAIDLKAVPIDDGVTHGP